RTGTRTRTRTRPRQLPVCLAVTVSPPARPLRCGSTRPPSPDLRGPGAADSLFPPSRAPRTDCREAPNPTTTKRDPGPGEPHPYLSASATPAPRTTAPSARRPDRVASAPATPPSRLTPAIPPPSPAVLNVASRRGIFPIARKNARKNRD
ncbi:hypothetical protein SORBI_3001G421600, partial [Sorghum bicolor]